MISKSKLQQLVKEEEAEKLRRQIRAEFVDRTNRQNLYTQIKKLVHSAKNCYLQNLEERRTRLRLLLEVEQAEYEEEFIHKVKARVEEHVRERQDSLMALKIQKAKQAEEFVKKKRIQQYMNNCDEIRLTLRNRLLKETKECQLLQIKEKREKELQERADDFLWLQVRKRIQAEQDKRQQFEDCLKKLLMKTNRKALDNQILERKASLEITKKEAVEERLRNEKLVKAELKNATFAEELEKKKKMKQTQELRIQLKEGILQKKIKQQKDAYFECIFNEEIRGQREREQHLLKLKESSMKEATLRYLEYLQSVKKELKIQEEHQDKAFETYRNRAECITLKKIQEIKIQKQNEAKRAHQQLLAQICENEEKRLKEKQAEFESALVQRQIYQNELQEENEKQLRRNHAASTLGKELLNQIEELRAFQVTEKARFEEELKKAEDEDNCRDLARKYIEQEVEYLPPHPNWKLICCSCISKN